MNSIAEQEVMQVVTRSEVSSAEQRAFVIIGGGAGGLELACKLGRKLGPGRVTLVDRQLNHIWKPTLHEVAAGSLDVNQEGLSYLMLAHMNNFEFILGPMTGVDAPSQHVHIGAVQGSDEKILLPEREIRYESLIIAVGSTANYFGIPGAEEHTLALDDVPSAEQFRLHMLRALVTADGRKHNGKIAGIDIVIIGAGATGVELAAELREANRILVNYGFRQLDPDTDVRLTLLEGAERILPPLPEKLAASATRQLADLRVTVVTNCKVSRITGDFVEDANGNRYPADLCVWTAGIKAAAFLAELGLSTSRGDLLEVNSQLQVVGQKTIYALGDCADCQAPDGGRLPPRAQTAHQQADYLFERFVRQERNQPLRDTPFELSDHGSLVSLGRRRTVGNLTGALFKSSWFVEGLFARMMYTGLHLIHHQALLGTLRTGVLAIARFLVTRTKPRVKLH